MGPLVSGAHRDKVASYVPDDAPVAFRGTAPTGRGFWFPPTVLTPQRTDRAVTDEIFGPVVTVLAFDDEADAIALANDTAYGLSGSIWTDDLSRALRVSRAVEAGNLSVNSHSSVRYNTPFGGFKQSGLGRELGPGRAAAFHRDQERVHRDQGGLVMDLTRRLAGRVAVITGGGSGIGLAAGAADARRRRDHRRRRHRRRRRRGGGRGACPVCLCPWMFPTRARSTRCSTPRRRPMARSTSRSTTPASRRPTTT